MRSVQFKKDVISDDSKLQKVTGWTIRRILVITGRIMLILLLVVITLLLIFDRFVEFRESDADLAAYFTKKHIPTKIGYYSSNGRKLRYLSVGKENAAATILFIHGAPSSVSYYKSYFSDDSLLAKAHMISVDRPGYGYSGLGKPVTSLETQAKMIRPLLDSLNRIHHPLIIVAASYGTSVACRLAMDYPDLVDGLVLVAPALAPGQEKIYTVGYLAKSPLIRWMVPRMLISANEEKFSHKAELEKMLPYWKNITMPVIYLQGKNDGLIYTSNAEFAREKLVNAACLDIYMIPGRGHLIAFLEIKKIKKAIHEMLQLSKKFYCAGVIKKQPAGAMDQSHSLH